MMWHAAIKIFGFTRSNVTLALPIALLICRSCPPVNYLLPPFFRRIVLPTTAASDVDAMRRAAGLQVEGMHGFQEILCDYRVLALQKAIGGRTRRLSTDKRPLLFNKVRDFWLEIERKHASSPTHVRDGFAVVIAIYLGTRVSELTAFDGEHIQVASTASETSEHLLVTFKRIGTPYWARTNPIALE
jgi:integrase